MYVLRRGQHGREVELLQQALNERAVPRGLPLIRVAAPRLAGQPAALTDDPLDLRAAVVAALLHHADEPGGLPVRALTRQTGASTGSAAPSCGSGVAVTRADVMWVTFGVLVGLVVGVALEVQRER